MDATFIIMRWLHFLFGIMWIGILYYFNMVQTPFFGETDPAVRSGAIQKLVPRAMWWFRWGAMGTVIIGWLYMLMWWDARLDWAITPWTVAILTGGTIGTIMFLNVWLVIWPAQKIVIANAIAVAGGAAANPAAAARGQRSGFASRTNTLLSIPMLFFMGAASHYALFTEPKPGRITAWILICGVIILAVEGNALFGTTGPGKKMLGSVSGVIHGGIVLTIVLAAVIMIVV